MVKKLKYLLFLIPFFTILNVNAYTMPTPSFVNARFSDGSVETSVPGYSQVEYFASSQWYYKSNYLLGGVSSAEYVNRINYGWNNPNLCDSNSELEIKGSIAVIQDFFNNEQYDIEFYSNGSKMSCNFNFDNTVNPTFAKLDYTCTGRSGGGMNLYIYQLSHHYNNTYQVGFKRDITYSCDVSNGAIIQNDNNNTQNIINNNTQNSQNIINNQNSNTNQIIQDNQQNTQDIINNQNQNTQQEIESQQVCETLDKNKLGTDNKYLNSNGQEQTSSGGNYAISSYIKLTNRDKLKTLQGYSSGDYLCFYNTNKVKISCFNQDNLVVGTFVTIPDNTEYFRYTIRKSENRPVFELCKNGNQVLNDSLNGLNDTLNDTSQPNTNQDINDMNDMVASDTPISDLITMPLTLINAYINGVNSSCSPVNLGNLYGTDLVLPCINLEQRLGSNLWHIIDSFFSIFMCYNIGMLFVTAFDGLTSLRDDFEGLYQPRHADTGYQPKHGG